MTTTQTCRECRKIRRTAMEPIKGWMCRGCARQMRALLRCTGTAVSPDYAARLNAMCDYVDPHELDLSRAARRTPLRVGPAHPGDEYRLSGIPEARW